MRINSIKLNNFKCFEKLHIKTPKITLLTGANSSGKSSVLQGVLVAAQSPIFPHELSLNGEYVELGNFETISFSNNKKNIIDIGFEVEDSSRQGEFVTKWKIDETLNQPKACKAFVRIDDFEKELTEHDLSDGIYHSLFSNLIELNYISAYRLHPERTYLQNGGYYRKIGKFGKHYTNQILLWEVGKASEYQQLVSNLRGIGLANNVQSNQLPGGRYELLVNSKKGGVTASLNDVGFGISQFLPIAVADVQLDKGSTLLVEQPEIHLHPEIQANLANYFTRQANENAKNYLIETHSEYLLNRFRALITKGELKEEDIAIYYIQNDGQKAVVHDLKFTPDGQIHNAPEDFFKTYMMDVMDIALNAQPA